MSKFLSLQILALVFFSASYAEENLPIPEGSPCTVLVQIRIACPMSEKLDEFGKSIPLGQYSPETWKAPLINNLEQLIELIKDEKTYQSQWNIQVDPLAE